MSAKFTQEYVFVWRIQNFSNNFYRTGEAIDSPVFTVDSLRKSKWFLKIYPQGYKAEHKGFFSVFLYNVSNDDCTEEYELEYELEIIDVKENILCTAKIASHIYTANSAWGAYIFGNRKFIYDKLKDGLNDVLTLRCRMFFNSQQNKPGCEARTEICVDRQSDIWNIRIPDISTKIYKKEIHVSNKSVFEVFLDIPEGEIKIDILPKTRSTETKSVTCKMSLIDSKGKELIAESATHLFEANDKNDKWNFPVFITKKVLNDNKNVFVEKDTICLLSQFVVSNGVITNTILGSNNSTDSCSALQMQLKCMLLDDTYSDVKLKVGNEIVQAHKCILAARSPVFSAMFQQDMIESKTNTVDICDVEMDTLKSFLRFIYTETIESLDYEIAKKLLLVAEKYQVLTLKEKCVSFLESVLSLGNVFEILSLADMIGHEHLKYAAANTVVANSKIVVSLPGWSNLMQNNSKLATEIISKIVSTENK